MTQECAALLLRDEVARRSAKHPFLEAGVAIRASHDDAGSLVLRQDGEPIGDADQGLGRNCGSADFAPDQPMGDVIDASFGRRLIFAGLDQLDDDNFSRFVQQRQRVSNGAACLAGPGDHHAVEFEPFYSWRHDQHRAAGAQNEIA